MEDALINLLAETQSSAEAPRKQAEDQLLQLYYDENFPLNLCSIASNPTHPLDIRQSALLTLKTFVLDGWSASLDEFKGQVLIGDPAKERVRTSLLDLATSGTAERKIQNAASYVVSKIASADYPTDWPGLLPALLQLIPEAADARLHGALKVLAEMLDDGLSEDQFFNVAQDLVRVLYTVAADSSQKPSLRALAVSVFKSCFDILEMIMEDHKAAVKGFAEGTINSWMPFFLDVLRIKLPEVPTDQTTQQDSDQQEYYRGLIALKLQVVKTLMRIRVLFPSIIAPQSPQLFSATWEELSTLQPTYQAQFIEDEQEGRLEDSDGLPYTLDFLVLEDLDFMQACIRAPPVKKELENQLQAASGANGAQQNNWIIDVIKLAISYSQITTEEEGIWQIDVNVFLSEETSVTANYTARTACGDLIIKLGEWLSQPTMDGLLAYVKTLYSSEHSWRPREASLYILNQVLADWQDVERKLDPNTAMAFIEPIQLAIQQQDVFLRARGFLAAAVLARAAGDALYQVTAPLLESTLRSVVADSSDVVQVSCIHALQNYLESFSPASILPMQSSIISTLSEWLNAQDLGDLADSDDLWITLLETLRDAILLDTQVCISGDGLNLLFKVASQGASNLQIVSMVTETFEEICNTIASLDGDAYVQLCQRVLPSLTGAFDIGNLTEENALTNIAAEMLVQLAKFGPTPLPQGFVSAALPKVNRVLLGSNDEELLKHCTEAVKYMLMKDVEQVLAWTDTANGKTGLEAVLVIVDRLLSPFVDDNAAAEVGGLAAEVVDKVGADRLGPYLTQLLQAVAARLASANQAQLIQSLILVFARLSISNPRDVVDFLSQFHVDVGKSALQVVLEKWLENSVNFAGYDEIRQNVIALTKLYALHDERLAQVVVRGDLIINPEQGGRIMTRSKARQMPDQYTTVPVPLKILKVLVEEVVPPGMGGLDGANGAAAAAQAAPEELGSDEEDGDWEDEPADALDLGLGMTKQDLMAFADEAPGAHRQADDETQGYLRQFFQEAAMDERFQEVFAALNQQEQDKLRALS